MDLSRPLTVITPTVDADVLVAARDEGIAVHGPITYLSAIHSRSARGRRRG